MQRTFHGPGSDYHPAARRGLAGLRRLRASLVRAAS